MNLELPSIPQTAESRSNWGFNIFSQPRGRTRLVTLLATAGTVLALTTGRPETTPSADAATDVVRRENPVSLRGVQNPCEPGSLIDLQGTARVTEVTKVDSSTFRLRQTLKGADVINGTRYNSHSDEKLVLDSRGDGDIAFDNTLIAEGKIANFNLKEFFSIRNFVSTLERFKSSCRGSDPRLLNFRI